MERQSAGGLTPSLSIVAPNVLATVLNHPAGTWPMMWLPLVWMASFPLFIK